MTNICLLIFMFLRDSKLITKDNIKKGIALTNNRGMAAGHKRINTKDKLKKKRINKLL